MAGKVKPTALLCATDEMAIGALRALREVEGGDRVSVIGHDDLPMGAYSAPAAVDDAHERRRFRRAAGLAAAARHRRRTGRNPAGNLSGDIRAEGQSPAIGGRDHAASSVMRPMSSNFIKEEKP